MNDCFVFLIIFIYLLAFEKSQEKVCSNLTIRIKEISSANKILEEKIKNLEKENKELKEWKRKKEEEKSHKEKEEKEEDDNNEIILFNKLDSKLIQTREEFNLLYRRLKKTFKEITDFKLLYRGSIDGKNSSSFHQKCDGIGNTISIIRSNTNYIFGGYATNKWTENAFSWVYDDLNSFVFSFNLMKVYNST